MAKISEPQSQKSGGHQGLSYQLGQAFFNAPLALVEHQAGWLSQQIQTGAFDADIAPAASKFIGRADDKTRTRITEDGIAVVSVAGLLLDRGAFLGDIFGWVTSYEGLSEQFKRLGEDAAIKSIVLDINSGGGMVAGLADLCADIEDLRKQKPVYAIAQNMAASAAYAIGCSADEMHVTRAGTVGSVGVIMLHASMARMLEAAGYDVTLITAGDRKADGNPFQALGHGARTEFAASVDRSMDQFVAHVASRRPNLTEEDVRKLEAACFEGELAVEVGLADSVCGVSDLLKRVQADLKSRGASARGKGAAKAPSPKGGAPKAKGKSMSNETEPGLTQADVDKAAAAARSAAMAEAQAAERQRFTAINQAAGASEFPSLTAHLISSGVEADAAAAILKAAATDVAGRNEAKATESTAVSGLGNALAAQMANPANSARVAPVQAPAASTLPSLADKARKLKR